MNNIIIVVTILLVIIFILSIKKQYITLTDIIDKCINNVILKTTLNQVIPDDIDNFLRDNVNRLVIIYNDKFDGIVIYNKIENDTIMYHMKIIKNNHFVIEPLIFSSNLAYINHAINIYNEKMFGTINETEVNIIFANKLPCEIDT
jgi:hypothetical protein